METEDDYDKIQEWAAGGRLTEKSAPASHSGRLVSPESEEEGNDAGSADQVQEEPPAVARNRYPILPATPRRQMTVRKGHRLYEPIASTMWIHPTLEMVLIGGKW